MEDIHVPPTPPDSGRGSLRESANEGEVESKLKTLEEGSEMYLYSPEIQLFFSVDQDRHRVCFVSSKEDAHTFLVYKKGPKQPDVYGLQSSNTKTFLFSAAPLTSAFHGM